jgi:retron-type reverse transcriptase
VVQAFQPAFRTNAGWNACATTGMGLFDWFRKRKQPPPATGGPGQVPPAPPPLPGSAAPPRAQKKLPRRGPLNLDLGQFAPLSHADAKAQAKALGNPWRTAMFGRRDLIPPVSDARTLLVDRAMVGFGFITPEDLAEIHKLGEQMDAVRPDLALAAVQADEAVRRDKDERAALKARKKAEAAERKRQHAEAVALRKQTDIVFLGRGVSTQLHDRRANVEKLQAGGLPLLASPADVAAALGVPVPRLRWLAFHSEAATVTHYVRFTVPKRSGGTRQLFAPHDNLAAAQQWVLTNILEEVPVHPNAHGFVPGRSTVTNATPHVRKKLVVNADLTDFFPTITFPRVRGIFKQLGYSPAAATVLALLCTESPRKRVTYAGKPFHVAAGPRALPQGACTSPALSNLAARRLDSRLNGIAKKLGWTYTRYADDLSFSCDAEAADKVGYLLARVRHVAQDEGFAVNEKKTRVLRPSAAQMVTGVVVNERPGVPRDVVRRMRAILHRAKTEGLAAQNRENHPNFEMWVRGMVAYVWMVNPKQGEPLKKALDAAGA